MAHPAETEESMPADNPREAVPPRVADASWRSVPRTPSTASALSTLSRTPSSSTLSETGEELELKTLKRSPSGLQLVDRDDALRLTGTWSWDLSKVRGHRFDTSPWRAALTCLDPSANEFWNVLTEILPVLHFSWVTLELLAGLALGRGSFASSPRPMAFAVLFTCSGTIAQHAASLVSHVGRSVSPRLSHSIWFIDFAGIALNNVCNAPVMAQMYFDSIGVGGEGDSGAGSGAAATWRELSGAHRAVMGALYVWGVVSCMLLVWGGVRRAMTFRPTARHIAESDSIGIWEAACMDRGAAVGASLILALVLPNAIFTALCGWYVDGRCPIGLIGMLASFVLIKELDVPNRWLKVGTLDFSPLHSHVLWHCGVWASQCAYLRIYMQLL